MRTATTLGVLLALAAMPAVGAPQDTGGAKASDTAAKVVVGELVKAAERAATIRTIREPYSNQVAPGGSGLLLTYLLTLHPTKAANALLATMDAAVDKQVGAAPTAGGTSLAQKGAIPAVLGLAVEHGAATEETVGTKVTFRANPAGIVGALQGNGLITAVPDRQSPGWQVISRFAAAATFDTSLGPQAAEFLADSQQLSAWSVTYEVHNGRNPRSTAYASLWASVAKSTQSKAYLTAAGDVWTALETWPGFVRWQQRLVEDVRAIDSALPSERTKSAIESANDRFRDVMTTALKALDGLQETPEVQEALDAYGTELAKIAERSADICAFAARGALVSVDWTTTRDPKLPDLYVLTSVWEQSFGKSRKNGITLNAALQFFRTTPEGASGRFKIFEATSEFSRLIGNYLQLSFVLSVSGKYQYIPNDTVATAAASNGGTASTTSLQSGASPASVVPKGHIGIVQLQLTIPVKGSGIKIPLSVTASNRTELVREKDVRANFGVTFSLDPLIAAAFGSR